jgi:hypothetical protein
MKKETLNPLMKVFQTNQPSQANNKLNESKKPSLAKALPNVKTLEEIENELLNNGSLKPSGNISTTTPAAAPASTLAPTSTVPAPPPGVAQNRNDKILNTGFNETSCKNLGLEVFSLFFFSPKAANP